MSENEQQDLGQSRLLEFKDEKRALLIGIHKSAKEKPSTQEHLDELENLGDTYGVITVEKMLCPIKKFNASTYIGSGKVEEIKLLAEEMNINLIIFDDEIAPHQQRNLEKIIQKTVIDRTELILAVFADHAKTKEARLQIKLAQYKYEFPRLKRLWTHLSRQRTGGGRGGYLKGAGERQIEIDRQILNKKISDLQKRLDEIKKQREVLRKRRKKSAIPSFAIIGYTNAGKSTLLNALTKADVLVEDKLFATLDTTIRKFILPNNQEIVLIDTVGFIRKLPHNLIAAFKSTLEEAIYADILLHLIDVSSPYAKEQAIASLEVLKKLHGEDMEIITCLNKIDKATDRSLIEYMKIEYPNTVEISAKEKIGFDELTDKMIEKISQLRKLVTLKIPQSYYHLVAEIIKISRVISCDYVENDVLIKVEIPKKLESKVKMFEI